MSLLRFLILFLTLNVFCEQETHEDLDGTTVESFFKTGSKEFFSHQDANTVFQPTPVQQANFEQGQFENKRRLTLLEKQKLKQKSRDSKTENKTSPNLATREEILQAFGNPAEVGKKVALESLSPNSPPALKGLVAALNIGDHDLAKAYAKAYSEGTDTLVRYFKTLQSVLKTQTRLKDGQLSQIDWSNLDAATKEKLAQPFYEVTDLNQQELISKLQTILSEKEKEAAEVLELENSLLVASTVLSSNNLEAHRKLAEQTLNKVKFENEGQFILFAFLDPVSKESKNLLAALDGLRSSDAAKKVSVHIACLTLCSNDDFVTFGGGFDVIGQEFAKALWNKDSSGLLLIGQKSGRALTLTEASAEFLRHLVNKGA